MVGDGDDRIVMLDASFVFTDEALEWLRDTSLQPYLAVSRALVAAVDNDPDIIEHLRPWRVAPTAQRLAEFRNAVGNILIYDYREEQNSPPQARQFADRLMSVGEPLGEMLADEWIFLTSHSIAILARRAGKTIAAFRRAGIQVFLRARREVERGLDAIHDRIPEPVLNVMKTVGTWPRTRGAKIVLLGAELAAEFALGLGLAVTIVDAVRQGLGVIGGDP